VTKQIQNKLNIKDIFFMFSKTIIIYNLLYFSDYIFHLYNKNYLHPSITKFNTTLFVLIFAILLLKKYWVRILLLSLILFSTLIEYFYFQYFGTYVQAIGFYQIIMNTKETFHVLGDELNTMYIPFIIVLSIIFSIFILKRFLKVRSFRSNTVGIILILGLFLFSTYSTYSKLHSKSGKLWHKDAQEILPMPGILSSINYLRAFEYFLVGILPKKILSNNMDIFKPLAVPMSKKEIEDNNVIFIIGESLRAKQLGILGYKLNTTPKLAKIKKLKYKTVYSSGTMTKVSVSSLLNRVKYPGTTMQITKQDNNLFKLAKDHGYKTYFYSWQNNSQLNVIQNFMGRKYIDNYASREMLKRRIKHYSDYDDNLLTALKWLDLSKGKNFIVLHERGSHATYSKQYPKEYSVFKKAYDNTVLYTDYVISEIIKHVGEHTKKPTYVIFTSDHGELLHEHGRNGHGWFFPEVYKVPFIFYAANVSTDKISFENIQTHFDVSNLVTNFLGYKVEIKKENTIYVNGSDVDALAGYLKIKVDNNNSEIKVKKFR